MLTFVLQETNNNTLSSSIPCIQNRLNSENKLLIKWNDLFTFHLILMILEHFCVLIWKYWNLKYKFNHFLTYCFCNISAKMLFYWNMWKIVKSRKQKQQAENKSLDLYRNDNYYFDM